MPSSDSASFDYIIDKNYRLFLFLTQHFFERRQHGREVCWFEDVMIKPSVQGDPHNACLGGTQLGPQTRYASTTA